MKQSILRIAAVLICLLALGGNATAAEQPRNEPAQTAPDYVIGSEDVLDISVWKNADLSRVVTVRPDGMVSLPLIGDLKAAGLTPEQLKTVIEGRLKEYSASAVVSVIVQAVNSYKVFVLGEVRTPGMHVFKANATVLQAITMAGGFTEYASKNDLVLIRKKEDGSEQKIRLRFKDLVSLKEKDNKNIVLKPGDTIFVP